MVKKAPRTQVAVLLLDKTSETIQAYRLSDLQHMAYDIAKGDGSWDRDRATMGKGSSTFRGWYATQLCGGPLYHQGIVNFYFTKVSTPNGPRYVRNFTDHGGHPFTTMRLARQGSPRGSWHRSPGPGF